MNRRKFVLGAGSIVGGTAAAAAFAGSASAEFTVPEEGEDPYEMGSATLASDDGSIEHVSIYGDTLAEWRGFDEPATQFRIKISVSVKDSNENEIVNKEIYDTGNQSLDQDWGDNEEVSGPGTRGYIKTAVGLDSNGDHDPSTDWAIIQAEGYEDEYGLNIDPVPASRLRVDSDGDSRTFFVDVTNEFILLNDNGGVIDRTDVASRVTVDVENIAKETRIGDGDEGEDGAVGGTSNESTMYANK